MRPFGRAVLPEWASRRGETLISKIIHFSSFETPLENHQKHTVKCRIPAPRPRPVLAEWASRLDAVHIFRGLYFGNVTKTSKTHGKMTNLTLRHRVQIPLVNPLVAKICFSGAAAGCRCKRVCSKRSIKNNRYLLSDGPVGRNWGGRLMQPESRITGRLWPQTRPLERRCCKTLVKYEVRSPFGEIRGPKHRPEAHF